MKRKLGRVALASLLCLAGCRSLIGITALEVDEGDSGTQPSPDATAAADGRSDANGTSDTASTTDVTDAGNAFDAPDAFDAAPPPGPDGQAEIAACVAADAGCVPCCHSLPPYANLEQYGFDSGCLCGAGTPCAAANFCGSTFCANPSTEPENACTCCVDTLLTQSACAGARAACANDPSCAIAAQCVEACNAALFTCPGQPP